MGILLPGAAWIGLWWTQRPEPKRSAVVVAPQDLPKLGNGPIEQLVVVTISASFCVGNHVPGFRKSVGHINRLVESQADTTSLNFYSIGVSLDQQANRGIEYLDSLGTFTEIVSGGNWFNDGSRTYLLNVFPGPLAIPQIVILERFITSDTSSMHFDSATVLARIIGAREIVSWVNKGAPVTVRSRRPPRTGQTDPRKPAVGIAPGRGCTESYCPSRSSRS